MITRKVERKLASRATEVSSRVYRRGERKKKVVYVGRKRGGDDRVSVGAMIDRTTTRPCCSGRGSRATERERCVRVVLEPPTERDVYTGGATERERAWRTSHARCNPKQKCPLSSSRSRLACPSFFLFLSRSFSPLFLHREQQ